MANRITLPDGTIAEFPDHLTAEEIAERVKSYTELAAIGVSRSPRAMPVKVAPALPATTPVYAKAEWEPPPPRPEQSWAQAYIERQRVLSREGFFRVYGKHLGRRSVW